MMRIVEAVESYQRRWALTSISEFVAFIIFCNKKILLLGFFFNFDKNMMPNHLCFNFKHQIHQSNTRLLRRHFFHLQFTLYESFLFMRFLSLQWFLQLLMAIVIECLMILLIRAILMKIGLFNGINVLKDQFRTKIVGTLFSLPIWTTVMKYFKLWNLPCLLELRSGYIDEILRPWSIFLGPS